MRRARPRLEAPPISANKLEELDAFYGVSVSNIRNFEGSGQAVPGPFRFSSVTMTDSSDSACAMTNGSASFTGPDCTQSGRSDSDRRHGSQFLVSDAVTPPHQGHEPTTQAVPTAVNFPEDGLADADPLVRDGPFDGPPERAEAMSPGYVFAKLMRTSLSSVNFTVHHPLLKYSSSIFSTVGNLAFRQAGRLHGANAPFIQGVRDHSDVFATDNANPQSPRRHEPYPESFPGLPGSAPRLCTLLRNVHQVLLSDGFKRPQIPRPPVTRRWTLSAAARWVASCRGSPVSSRCSREDLLRHEEARRGNSSPDHLFAGILIKRTESQGVPPRGTR